MLHSNCAALELERQWITAGFGSCQEILLLHFSSSVPLALGAEFWCYFTIYEFLFLEEVVLACQELWDRTIGGIVGAQHNKKKINTSRPF